MSLVDIDRLTFNAQSEDEWMIFMGCKEFVQTPIWRPTPRGNRLDFTKSMAIQFVPSLVVEPDILLEGRMAIMQKAVYEMEGISWQPLVEWFRQVAKSFKTVLGASGAVLIQGTSQGTIKEWRQVLVSLEAVKWRQVGKRLKQFPKGEVEFDVKLPGSRPPTYGS